MVGDDSNVAKACSIRFSQSACGRSLPSAMPRLPQPNTRGSGAGRRRKKAPAIAKLGKTEVDEFGSETNGNGKEKTRIYTLPLGNNRSVNLQAPDTITKSELERIQKW